MMANEAASPTITLSLSLVPLIAAVLYAPGYIITFMVSRFTTGRPNFLGSLALSILYYIIAWTALGLSSDVDSTNQMIQYVQDMDFRHAVLYVVAGPIIAGLLFGVAIQKRWFYRLAREGLYWLSMKKFYLNPVHGIPAAWDWIFGGTGTQWITVYLDDGSKIVALYDAKSFVSTDPNERDIYVHEINKWTDKDGKPVNISLIDGVLLTGNSIRKIVFHSNSNPEKESSDD